MRQIDVTQQATVEAERIRSEAHDYAARVKALADKEAREARELVVMREEILRRKEDATNAARLEVQAEHLRAAEMMRAVEEERASLRKVRDRLEGMIAKVEKMLEPIKDYAAKWIQASPLIRQAMGARGPEAVKVVGSAQTAELAAMKALMGARGRGGR